MLCDQLMQHRDPGQPFRQPTAGQHSTSLVFDLDVMVDLSPIVPNKQHPAPSLTLLINKPRTAERTCYDLMDQCSPARHPTSTTGPLTKPPGHDLVIDLRPRARGLQSAHRQPARTTACRKACYCSPIRCFVVAGTGFEP